MASDIHTQLEDAIRNSAYVALSEYFADVPREEALIIFSHLNGTEPSSPYVIINVVDLAQVGRHKTSTLTNELEELSILNTYEARVQFSFGGSYSQNMVLSFVQRIGSNPKVLEELRRNKLGFMRKSSVRRNPQKRETAWVEFQNVDVTFSFAVNTQEVVDVVEAVVIQDFDGTVYTIPENITLP